MSKPSLSHVSVIKCSHTRKRCRNARFIGVSGLVHGFSDFCVLRPNLAQVTSKILNKSGNGGCNATPIFYPGMLPWVYQTRVKCGDHVKPT